MLVKKDGTGDYNSIQAAVNAASKHDTVLVSADTYTETVRIVWSEGMVLSGVDPTTTILDGQGTNRILELSSGKNVVVENFTFKNGKVPSDDPHGGAAIKISGSENARLQNLIIKDNVGFAIGVELEPSKPGTEIINVLSYNNNPGTYMSYGGKVNIINSTFINTSGDSEIQLNDRCCDQGESRARVLNSIIEGIIFKSYSPNSPNESYFVAANSYLSRKDSLNYKSQIFTGYNTEHFRLIQESTFKAPIFINRENGDFKLDNSPGIGQGSVSYVLDGDTLYAPKTDLLGNLRPDPNGSNPDIGAYENTQSAQIVYPVHTVKKDGTGDYATIQAALNASSVNDTITVYPEHLKKISLFQKE